MNNDVRRLWPLVAVGALLAAATVAAALSKPQISRVPFNLPVNRPSVAPSPAQESPFDAAGAPLLSHRPAPVIQLGWLGGLIEVACGILLAALAGVLIFLLLRGSLRTRAGRLLVEAERQPTQPRREDVLAAVDAGLSDLDDDRDPRRAVIACWVRLEQAAAAAGTPREAGDSPTDLVVRLLHAHQVSARVLYALADVYRLARYATRTVDTGMRDQARAALTQLRAELTTSRSGPLEQVP
ncbi:MAG TPA: DUF4129 domain-containing protein [Rugosimonospora sp.]|nr:DUF4129 domain-containing protein [Rugosimonospora sp.]